MVKSHAIGQLKFIKNKFYCNLNLPPNKMINLGDSDLGGKGETSGDL